MSRFLRALNPVNRHITIVPHFEKGEEASPVLLPEDFKPEEERYILATVVKVAPDCATVFQRLKTTSLPETNIIVVDKTMIEEVVLKDKVHYFILENYVMGIFRGLDEN